MSMIVEIPRREFHNYEINATQTKKLRSKKGFNGKIDCVITGLKGSVLMSPKLRSLTKGTRAKVPLYELNLSLFRNKELGFHE
jgi:hypothetical protein